MPQRTKYKLIAAFFFAVFFLNTAVGFACSIGIDMNGTSNHHNESTEAVVHIHADGKKHIHYEKKKNQDSDKSHNHQSSDKQSKTEKDKENCCSDEVYEFQKLDKSGPPYLQIIHPDFLIVLFDVWYDVALPTGDIVKDIKQFVRSYHPPISDIRIAIQSFQI